MITAVTGFIGSGKTQWIREQIIQAQTPALYFSPQAETFPIDALRLESEVAQVKILKTGTAEELMQFSLAGGRVYLELPWYLDLFACESLLQSLGCHRVAIMPPNLANTGWHAWADEIILGNHLEGKNHLDLSPNSSLQIQRALLTGEVLDFPSLETFWQELTQGAYGKVIRAKGLFNLADGQFIYGDFLQGFFGKDFEAVDLPPWLSGKPERFSGLEIIGYDLAKKVIIETLENICLSESIIKAFQQQAQLTTEEELVR